MLYVTHLLIVMQKLPINQMLIILHLFVMQMVLMHVSIEQRCTNADYDVECIYYFDSSNVHTDPNAHTGPNAHTVLRHILNIKQMMLLMQILFLMQIFFLMYIV